MYMIHVLDIEPGFSCMLGNHPGITCLLQIPSYFKINILKCTNEVQGWRDGSAFKAGHNQK